MSRFLLFAVLIATTLHSSFVDAVFSIEDVFKLGDNCATYETDLDEIYSEALDLLVSAVETIDDASNVLSSTYEEAWRILYTFFHDPSAADYTQIRQWYSDVENFLQDGFASGDKPWLFCGDDWALRQNMNDQMRTSTGALATKSDGSIYHISDNPDFVAFQQRSTTATGKTTYPYWSEEALGYVFMEDFGQTDPTKGFCSQTEISVQGTSYSGLGGTLSTNRLMILCPGSFTGTRLRQETPSCIPASLYGTTTKPSAAGAQRLMAIVPEVSTFFHELIHLVEGNGNTSPAGGEEYNVKAMLGPTFTKAQALANPETYTMVAIGYDYTLNTAPVNGHPIEYYTGYCTWDDGVAAA